LGELMSARLPEQKFWDWLSQKIPGHMQRVENLIDRGTPDVNLCHNGVHVWIELKVADNYEVTVRKEQKVWAFRRHRSGGRVILLSDMCDGTLWAWNMPCESVTKNEKYQTIVAEPDFVVNKDQVDSLIGWIFRKDS
jgi:hypothetical protein